MIVSDVQTVRRVPESVGLYAMPDINHLTYLTSPKNVLNSKQKGGVAMKTVQKQSELSLENSCMRTADGLPACN